MGDEEGSCHFSGLSSYVLPFTAGSFFRSSHPLHGHKPDLIYGTHHLSPTPTFQFLTKAPIWFENPFQDTIYRKNLSCERLKGSSWAEALLPKEKKKHFKHSIWRGLRMGYHGAPVCKSEAILAWTPLITKQAMVHKRVKIKQGRIISDSEYVPNVFSSVSDREGSPSSGLSHDIIKA